MNCKLGLYRGIQWLKSKLLVSPLMMENKMERTMENEAAIFIGLCRGLYIGVIV